MTIHADFAEPILVGTGRPGNDTIRQLDLRIPLNAKIVGIYGHRKFEGDGTPFSAANRYELNGDDTGAWSRFMPPTVVSNQYDQIVTSSFHNWSHNQQQFATIEVEYDLP